MAYQREESSGSQQLMKSLVMKNHQFEKRSERFDSTPHLIGRFMSSTYLELTKDRAGIGYSVYFYERFMSGSPRTRTIGVDGIEANYDTISAESIR